MSYPRREGENLYDRFADWFVGTPVFDFQGPVLIALPLYAAGFLVQLALMVLYGLCRLVLPRRWCP
jgi:hypothetical protein